ncbi:MAG: hypothetical protein ABJG15_07210 [Hyphomonadaceae bacterium]
MRNSGDAPADVRRFLETIGLEREQQPNGEMLPASSEMARASDVYQRALARACLSELTRNKAA